MGQKVSSSSPPLVVEEKYQLLEQTTLDEEDEDDEINMASEDDDEAVLVKTPVVEEESLMSISLQIMFPFCVAGLGMVGAGIVLDIVQHWVVFEEINELFILVPALLGLKGNLEMTLASRLSTQANLGKMDTRSDCVSMVTSNLALVQCQGIVVGFVASLVAMVMDWLPEGRVNIDHALLLCAASIVTASIASFVLGLVMIAVILLSRRCKINPDNVATPIAASLGDLVTLALLSWIASMLYVDQDEDRWLAPSIIIGYVLFTPLCIYFAKQNAVTEKVLYTGWTPVLIAMSISSLGGLILDNAVNKFRGIAVFQPVFNGVGGNLVAVQASRISTHLHAHAVFGILPDEDKEVCVDPCSVVFGSNIHSRTCRVLLLLVIPGHLMFAFTISFLQFGHTTVTGTFVVFYLCAAIIQIWILLHTAHWMIHLMWKCSVDPDNSAIPYLTALGDLLGGGLLALAFEILFLIGDRDSDVGD